MPGPLKHCFFLVSFLCTFFWAQGEDEWTQWRGPNGDGHAPEGNYPIRWGEHQNITWRTFLPGKGHFVPVVENGKNLAHQCVWKLPPLKGKGSEGQRKQISWCQFALFIQSGFLAIQLDLSSGEILKEVKVFEQRNPQGIHRLNSYASPSPLLSEGRLYVHFGTFGTACWMRNRVFYGKTRFRC